TSLFWTEMKGATLQNALNPAGSLLKALLYDAWKRNLPSALIEGMELRSAMARSHSMLLSPHLQLGSGMRSFCLHSQSFLAQRPSCALGRHPCWSTASPTHGISMLSGSRSG